MYKNVAPDTNDNMVNAESGETIIPSLTGRSPACSGLDTWVWMSSTVEISVCLNIKPPSAERTAKD